MPNSCRLHKKTGVRIPPGLRRACIGIFGCALVCARMRARLQVCMFFCPKEVQRNHKEPQRSPKETLKSHQESEEATMEALGTQEDPKRRAC